MAETAAQPRPCLLHQATVVSNRSFGRGFFELKLHCPELAGAMSPGQFINVRVGDGLYPLLRRPFSSFDLLKDARGRRVGISLLLHVVGLGTEILSRAKEGDKLSLNGALGHGFERPMNPDTRVIMVGGGIGLAPFLHLGREWGAGDDKRELMLLAGGRRSADLPFLSRFNDAGVELLVATEDGSAGVKGLVTVLLEQELAALGGRPAMVLTCGPWGMMAAVAKICAAREIDCYASLESVMACGYGVCNGCVARVNAPGSAEGFRYAKTCAEGTVMNAAEIDWTHSAV